MNDPDVTSVNQIKVMWDPPTFDGGTAVLYYRLWFDDATDGATFTVLAGAITDTYYVKTGLTEG